MIDKVKKKIALLTNDVETHSSWFNNLRDETGMKVLKEAMPALLDLFEKYDAKTTFFYTGYIAKLYPEVVKIAAARGHEIACHGLSHRPEDGFDVMPFETQKEHLTEAKKILEDISGQKVISFRAPALRVNQHTTRALIETGFRIDSSIASQRFDFFFSFGSREKLKFLTAPRLPYKTSPDHLHKKGEGPLVEVPVSAILFPYIGPSLRIFPTATRILRFMLITESRKNNKPIVFYSHPPEFIDERNELLMSQKVHRRVNNWFEYIVRDWVKTKLKHKNLGPVALPLLERELRALSSDNFTFATMRDYCSSNGLI